MRSAAVVERHSPPRTMLRVRVTEVRKLDYTVVLGSTTDCVSR